MRLAIFSLFGEKRNSYKAIDCTFSNGIVQLCVFFLVSRSNYSFQNERINSQEREKTDFVYSFHVVLCSSEEKKIWWNNRSFCFCIVKLPIIRVWIIQCDFVKISNAEVFEAKKTQINWLCQWKWLEQKIYRAIERSKHQFLYGYSQLLKKCDREREKIVPFLLKENTRGSIAANWKKMCLSKAYHWLYDSYKRLLVREYHTKITFTNDSFLFNSYANKYNNNKLVKEREKKNTLSKSNQYCSPQTPLSHSPQIYEQHALIWFTWSWNIEQ